MLIEKNIMASSYSACPRDGRFVPIRDMTTVLLHWCLMIAFAPPSLAFVHIQFNAKNVPNDNVFHDKMWCSKQTIQKSYHNSEAPSIDWNMYNLKHQYQKSGGILYKQSILSPKEYNTIMSELSRLDLPVAEEKESSFATNRMGCTIDSDTEIYKTLSCPHGSLSTLLYALECDGDEGIVVAPEVPVEVRLSLHFLLLV